MLLKIGCALILISFLAFGFCCYLAARGEATPGRIVTSIILFGVGIGLLMSGVLIMVAQALGA